MEVQGEVLYRKHGGETALTLACAHKLRPGVMRHIISRALARPKGRFNVNKRRRKHLLPIQLVCDGGEVEALDVLLGCPGIDVLCVDPGRPLDSVKSSPIYLAARRGHVAMVRALVQRYPKTKAGWKSDQYRDILQQVLLAHACKLDFLHKVRGLL